MLLKEGKVGFLWKNLSIRFYSTITSVGLKRDLHQNFTLAQTRIELKYRLFRPSDESALNEEHRHLRLVKENMKHCYVATTQEGTPCYRQWMIRSNENDHIKSYFGDLFPNLKSNEALVEGIFTHPSYRGLGIMPQALSEISYLDNEGLRYIILFVDIKNIPSLKGCKRAGFKPYILRKERWFLFKRKITFEAITDEIFKQQESIEMSPSIS